MGSEPEKENFHFPCGISESKESFDLRKEKLIDVAQEIIKDAQIEPGKIYMVNTDTKAVTELGKAIEGVQHAFTLLDDYAKSAKEFCFNFEATIDDLGIDKKYFRNGYFELLAQEGYLIQEFLANAFSELDDDWSVIEAYAQFSRKERRKLVVFWMGKDWFNNLSLRMKNAILNY